MNTSILVIFTLFAAIATASASWRNDALKLHNKYRKRHGSPPLKLDDTLRKSAQNCANRIAYIGALQHTNGIKYGENLGQISSTGRVSNTKAAKDIIRNWYNEKSDYDYNNYQNSRGGRATGHFTQLVWKATSRIGIAIARNGGNIYICAQYSPRGNFYITGNAQKSYSNNVRRS